MADITIPPAALEAGIRAAIAADSGPEGSKLFEIHWAEFADSYREGIRAAFLAMIEAWPGMRERPFWDFMTGARHIEIILPIPKGLDFIDPLTAQENPDAEA